MTEWECPHGCELSHVACDHLEALLPPLRRGRVSVAQPEEILSESFFSQEDSASQFEEDDFRDLLNRHGISCRHQSELLILKFVEGMSNVQIGAQFGLSEGAIRLRLKDAFKTLTENGLTLEER